MSRRLNIIIFRNLIIGGRLLLGRIGIVEYIIILISLCILIGFGLYRLIIFKKNKNK